MLFRSDQLASVLRYRRAGDAEWTDVAMEELPNDRWRASFVPTELGRWRYTIRAWIDEFGHTAHAKVRLTSGPPE